MTPYLVRPSASTVGVRALVSGEDVDKDTGTAVLVGWALAVSSTAIAGEGDRLACEAAVQAGGRLERVGAFCDPCGDGCSKGSEDE